jgi:hypothetical protein
VFPLEERQDGSLPNRDLAGAEEDGTGLHIWENPVDQGHAHSSTSHCKQKTY